MREAELAGGYVVTDEGDVYSFKSGDRRKLVQTGTSRNRKYKVVCLSVCGVTKQYYVHILVANAFVPNPDKKPQVNHIDGDPTNNHFENLEWVTASENIRHAYDTGLVDARLCVRCGNTFHYKNSCALTCSKCRAMAADEWDERYRKQKRTLLAETNTGNSQQDEMRRLYATGVTQKHIAEMFGVSKQRVNQILKKGVKVL